MTARRMTILAVVVSVAFVLLATFLLTGCATPAPEPAPAETDQHERGRGSVTNIRNEIAEYIRRTDGGNRMEPYQLGVEIANYLSGHRLPDLIGFVQRTNPDKAMGAGALADAIVDHFGLDPQEAA